jgi:hypothetical protein
MTAIFSPAAPLQTAATSFAVAGPTNDGQMHVFFFRDHIDLNDTPRVEGTGELTAMKVEVPTRRIVVAEISLPANKLEKLAEVILEHAKRGSAANADA